MLVCFWITKSQKLVLGVLWFCWPVINITSIQVQKVQITSKTKRTYLQDWGCRNKDSCSYTRYVYKQPALEKARKFQFCGTSKVRLEIWKGWKTQKMIGFCSFFNLNLKNNRFFDSEMTDHLNSFLNYLFLKNIQFLFFCLYVIIVVNSCSIVYCAWVITVCWAMAHVWRCLCC